MQHFNDDAVFGDSPNPEEPPLEWNELRYPSQHPFAGQSIDLAFVITPEPATLLVLALGLLPVLIGKNRKFNKHS